MRIVAIANQKGGPESLAPGPFGTHGTLSLSLALDGAPLNGGARGPATPGEQAARPLRLPIEALTHFVASVRVW